MIQTNADQKNKVDIYNSIEKIQSNGKLLNSYNNSLDIGNSINLGKDMVKVGSLLPIKSERGVNFN